MTKREIKYLRERMQRSSNGNDGDVVAVAKMFGVSVQTVNLAIKDNHPTDRRNKIVEELKRRVMAREQERDRIAKL